MRPKFISLGINLPVREVGGRKGIEIHFLFVIFQHYIAKQYLSIFP